MHAFAQAVMSLYARYMTTTSLSFAKSTSILPTMAQKSQAMEDAHRSSIGLAQLYSEAPRARQIVGVVCRRAALERAPSEAFQIRIALERRAAHSANDILSPALPA
jgi:hypothetical protein